jgi:serine/threonine-protein kinase
LSGPQKKRDKSRDRELIGKTIAGKYRILEVLGQGGFGSVFLVEIVAGLVGEKLALKLVPADLSGNERVKAQFLNEIRVAMRPEMVNKYIVQFRDVGETEDGDLYFTMDYCAGETLAAVLAREDHLPPPRAILIARRILEALKTAHAAGVIHRDLKPANVMIIRKNSHETVRVLDFGIATAVSRRNAQEVGFAGSIHYMPPEQFQNQQLGFYTDTYAVGVILYECLTGKKPYHGRTAKEVFDDLKSRPAVPPERIKPHIGAYPGLSQIVSRAIERKPELRFATAREFLEGLQSILEPRDGPAAPPPPVRTATARIEPPLPEPPPKERAAPAGRSTRGSRPSSKPLAVGLILMLGAAGFWVAWKSGKSTDLTAVREEKQGPAGGENASLRFQRRLGNAIDAQKKNSWGAVLAETEEALKIDPKQSEVHRLRGEALLRLGKPGEAIRAFQKARAFSKQSDPGFNLMVLEAYDGVRIPDEEAKALESQAFHELSRDPLNWVTTPKLLEVLSRRKGDVSAEVRDLLERARNQQVPGVEPYYWKFIVEPQKSRTEETLRAVETALAAGDFRGALDKADDAVRLGPVQGVPLFEARARALKAEAQIGKGSPVEALVTLKEAWDKVPPREKPPARLLSLILKAHDESGAPDAAAVALRERAMGALKGQPIDRAELPGILEGLDRHQWERDLVVLLKLAKAQQVSDPLGARLEEKYFKQLPEAREVEAEKLYQEAQTAFKGRDFARVAEVAKRGESLKPIPELGRPPAEVFLNLALLNAEARLEENDAKAAKAEIERIGRQAQKPPARLQFLTGRLRLAEGTADRALASFKEALDQSPPGARGQEMSSTIRTYMARAYALRGDADKVEEMLKLAGNASESALLSHQAESFCLVAENTREPERRERLYAQARTRLFNIPAEKRSPRDHNLIGHCYSNQAEYAKATASFAKAQKAYENDARFWMNYGKTYQKWAAANKGSVTLYNEAAGRYKKSFEISKAIEACKASANSYLLAGYKNQAKAIVEKGLQIDPKDPELKSLLAKCR